MRSVTINLPDHVAHRLEICAAKEDLRLHEELERWLTELVEDYERRSRTPIKQERKTVYDGMKERGER